MSKIEVDVIQTKEGEKRVTCVWSTNGDVIIGRTTEKGHRERVYIEASQIPYLIKVLKKEKV